MITNPPVKHDPTRLPRRPAGGQAIYACGTRACWAAGPPPALLRTVLNATALHHCAAAGRLTGQATGFLYRARSKFFKFAEDAEVTKVSSWWS